MIVLLILLVIYVFGLKRGTYDRLSLEHTYFDNLFCNYLKGICAMYIMLGHYSMYIPFKGILFLLRPIQPGAILVNGLFFFISGYGLEISRETKPDYIGMRSYLKRMWNIGIVAYASYLISFCFFEVNSLAGMIKHILLFNVFRWFHLNQPTWFLIEIVFLYLLFWLIFYLVGHMRIAYMCIIAVVGMTVIIIIWYVAAVLTGRGVVWYSSTLCFPLGILVANTRDSIIYAKARRYVLPIASVLLICCFLYNKYSENIILGAFLGNIASLVFCIVVFLLSFGFTLDSRILGFLGSISFELYLIHIYMIELTAHRLPDLMAVLISIGGAIIVAMVLHKFCGKIRTLAFVEKE